MYVLRFMTNVVCQNLLYVEEFFFNNEHLHFHKREKTVAMIKWFNDHYFMENNTGVIFNLTTFIANNQIIFVFVFIFASALKIPIKSINVYEWHRILDHVSKDAIHHLSASVEEMIISDAISF